MYSLLFGQGSLQIQCIVLPECLSFVLKDDHGRVLALGLMAYPGLSPKGEPIRVRNATN